MQSLIGLAGKRAGDRWKIERIMGADELAKVVRDTIAEVGATSKAEMGTVMKALQEKVAARTDGKTLSQEVQKQLG